MNKPLRALTWKEPFGSLMLHEKIETRTWSTKYRGEVLICVGKTPYSLVERRVMMVGFEKAESLLRHAPNNKGKAIAVATLVDCRPMRKEDEEACFLKYRDGLWCHVYENVRPIKPIPFKGQQGWKKLDKEFWSQIQFQ